MTSRSEKWATVIRLHADGWGDEAIAAHEGLTRSTISYRRRLLGLPALGRTLAAERRAAILALRAAGFSRNRIAKLLRIDRATVIHHLRAVQ